MEGSAASSSASRARYCRRSRQTVTASPAATTTATPLGRTFFANHFGILTSGSAVTFYASGSEVINADVSPFRSAPSSVARTVHVQSPSIFDRPPALESALSGCQASQAHVHPTTRTGFSSGRDPPLLLGPSRLGGNVA